MWRTVLRIHFESKCTFTLVLLSKFNKIIVGCCMFFLIYYLRFTELSFLCKTKYQVMFSLLCRFLFDFRFHRLWFSLYRFVFNNNMVYELLKIRVLFRTYFILSYFPKRKTFVLVIWLYFYFRFKLNFCFFSIFVFIVFSFESSLSLTAF